MKFVSLLSGGKDSVLAIHLAVDAGHELVCCANLAPNDKGVEELDSWMYQTVGSNAVPLISNALGVPLYVKKTRGESVNTSLTYSTTESDEVEDMLDLIRHVKKEHPEVEAIVSGAVLSRYQKNRVEYVCEALGLTSIAPLWQMDQEILLDTLIEKGIDAIIIKVAGFMLSLSYIGCPISSLRDKLINNYRKNGVSCVGEGGEYESLTINAPLFSHKVNLINTNVVVRKSDMYTPEGYLSIHVEDKELEADKIFYLE